MKIVVDHCHATLISEESSETWYIATCKGKNDVRNYKIHHIMRVKDGKNLKWKNQPKPGLPNLHIDSIFECKIDGEWNVSNERSFTFSLRNHIQIFFSKLSFTETYMTVIFFCIFMGIMFTELLKTDSPLGFINNVTLIIYYYSKSISKLAVVLSINT